MRGEEMNIETDFTSSTLELSHPVGEKTWETATDTAWPDGWRMPHRCELVKVYDEAVGLGHKFSDRTLVWSASSCAPDPSNAWNVFFNSGYSYAYNKTNDYSVRLVREVRK
jgi:hypothetical protein